MRVAITGATGLVGRALTRALVGRGDEVLAFTRDPERALSSLPEGVEAAGFDPASPESIARSLRGSDAAVGLAGEPVLGRRWTRRAREAIRASRVDGTRAVVAAMRGLPDGPRTLVNASAVGYYGARGAEELDETAPPGDDFLAGVCVEWEAAAREAEAFGARVVRVRIGIVLSPDGGALKKMLPPFRIFLGGRIGHGRQPFPWIHIDDLVGILLHALSAEEMTGPVNATAPHPLSNRDFCRALGRALRRPSWLPVPRPVLRLAVGPASRVLTTGQRAIPRRALDAGYVFRHPVLDAALEDLLS